MKTLVEQRGDSLWDASPVPFASFFTPGAPAQQTSLRAFVASIEAAAAPTTTPSFASGADYIFSGSGRANATVEAHPKDGAQQLFPHVPTFFEKGLPKAQFHTVETQVSYTG